MVRYTRRLWACVLCVCMLASAVGTDVLAAGISENGAESRLEQADSSAAASGNQTVNPSETVSGNKPGDSSEGESSGSVSGNKPGEGSEGEGSGSVSGNKPGDSGSVSGNKPGEGSGSVSGNKPGDSGSVSGNKPGEGSGSVSGNKPGEGSGSVSGNKPGDSGSVSGNKPGDSGSVSGNIVDNGEWALTEDGTLRKGSEHTGIKKSGNQFPEGVKKIPAGIFSGNEVLEEIIIPYTVTEIEAGAFKGAYNLKSVIFETDPESNRSGLTELRSEVFAECENLGYRTGGALEIPEGIRKIGDSCFEDCTQLQGMDLPGTLEEIGRRAFFGCKAMTNITLEKTAVKTIKEQAFRDASKLEEVTFPASLSSLGRYAFQNTTKLYIVDFSRVNGAELALGQFGFSRSGLRNLKLPPDMSVIPEGAFEECTALSSLTLGADNDKGLKTIEKGAFKGCTGLTKLILKRSVDRVRNGAFEGCSKLKTVEIRSWDEETGESTIFLDEYSFPANNGMSVRGYGGTVQEWAGKHSREGVKYEPLYEAAKLVFQKTGEGTCEVASSEGDGEEKPKEIKVKVGDTVALSVKAADNYSLVSLSYGREDEEQMIGSSLKFTVKPGDIEDGEVVVRAVFKKNNATQKYTWRVDGRQVYIGEEGRQTHRFDCTRQFAQLTILDDSTRRQTVNWAWEFASNNSAAVSVDQNGRIRSLKETDGVKITATLKGNNKIQLVLWCQVGEDLKLKEITGFDFTLGNRMREITDDPSGLPVIQVPKSWVKAVTDKGQTRNFTAAVEAENTKGKKIDGGYSWSCSDSRVVTLGSGSTSAGANTIKICGVGETVVTVKSKIKDVNDEYPLKRFIVRVVDMTPYIEETSIKVNPKSEEPAVLTLIPAYSGELDGTSIELKKMNSSKKWVSVKGLAVQLAGDDGNGGKKVRLLLSGSTYKNASETSIQDLYLHVVVDGSEYCYIKMPEIVITPKEPKPTVKLTGKINKFYTGSAKEQGQIKAAVTSPKGYIRDTAVLPVLENLNTDDKNKDFAENFEVRAIDGDDKKFLIVQKTETLQPENKPAVSGYLKIKYVGYDPVKVKITVPTQNTAPAYQITPSSVTANINAKEQEYAIQLIDKKTKKVQELDGFQAFYHVDSSDMFGFGASAPVVDSEKDVIRVKLPGAVTGNAKAILVLRREDWGSGLKMTLTIKATSAKPKVKLGTSVIALNRSVSESNSTTAGLNQQDAKLESMDTFEPVGRNAWEANKLLVSYDKASGRIMASVKEQGQFPADGTYSFRTYPQIRYDGTDRTDRLSALTVKVKVGNQQPRIKLKSSVFRLNQSLAPGMETAQQTYTWIDLPEADGFREIPDMNGLTLRYSDKNGAGSFKNDGSGPIQVDFREKEEEVKGKKVKSLVMSVQTGTAALHNGTRTFVLSGMTTGGKAVKDLSIKVQAVAKRPDVTLSASGSLNVLDEKSAVTYKVKVKNFSGQFDGGKLQVLAESTKEGGWESDPEKLHFMLEPDPKNENQIFLKVRPDKEGDIEKRAYKLQLGITVAGETLNKTVKVTPKQITPKLTFGTTKLTGYMRNPSRRCITTIEADKKTPAEIVRVEWGKKASDTLKEAFCEPRFEDGKLVLQVRNPALLKRGATYDLPLTAVYKNQFKDAAGTNFTMKFTIR